MLPSAILEFFTHNYEFFATNCKNTKWIILQRCNPKVLAQSLTDNNLVIFRNIKILNRLSFLSP